jgi:hypothetical protein
MGTRKRIFRPVLLAVVALAAVAYAGSRWWIGYQAGRQLQALGDLLAPHVALTWDDVSGDLTGEVVVSGLVVTPEGVLDEVYVERVSLRADGLKDLAALARTVRAGQLPEYLELTFRGAMLRVGGPLHQAIERHARLWGTPLDAAACDVEGNLGAVVMSALGYNTLDIDGTLRWRLHPPTHRAAVLADVTVDDVGTTSVDAHLELARLGFDPETWLADLAPALTSLRLRLSDHGFIASRNHVCAARRDVAVDAFMALHLDAVRDRYARAGIPLGDMPLEHYAEFARHGGDLLFDLEPRQPLPPARVLTALRQREVADIPVSLTINGRPLAADASRWLPPPAPSSTAAAKPAAAPPRGPQRVAPAALVEHVGARAQIVTSDGRAHQGVIASADAERLTLRKVLEGGHLDYRIPYATIETAEVYR